MPATRRGLSEQRVISTQGRPNRTQAKQRPASQAAPQAKTVQQRSTLPPAPDVEAYDDEQPELETDNLPVTYGYPTAEQAQAEQKERNRQRDDLLHAVRQTEANRAARTSRAATIRQPHPDYAITEETAPYDTRSPNSAVRYEQPQRTAQARARNTTAQQPIRRTSSQDAPHTTALDGARYRRKLRLSRSLIAIGLFTAIVCFMGLGAIIAPAIGGTVQGITNRITYGDPPTTRYDVFLGHYGRDTSHIEASNQGGKIYISERSNGAELNPKLYFIITVTGQDAGSYPVTLQFTDINHDGKTDILINVKGFQIPLYNTGTGFTATHP